MVLMNVASRTAFFYIANDNHYQLGSSIHEPGGGCQEKFIEKIYEEVKACF